ncbi:O-antigen ligase family protein [Leptospira ilyithenensis]|nr:O-antigen ligase family protein [Leptospira ilyithenensis]
MSRKETFQKLTVVFLSLFWVTVPFSVSVSQISAIISMFCFVLVFRFPKPGSIPIFWIGIAFYFWIFGIRFLSGIEGLPEWKKILIHSEFSDFWMFLLLPVLQSQSRKDKTKIRRFVQIGACFLILSGLVSVVFPYRLAGFVMDGFQYLEGKRLPHLIGHLPGLGIPLYLPIGFQNTHLTYGGLLSLFLSFLILKTFRLFKLKKLQRGKFSGKILFLLFLSFSGVLLLFLNQSRSIWIGLSVSLIFYLSIKRKTHWEPVYEVLKKSYIRIIVASFIFLFVFFALYRSNWLFQRSIDQLFTKQTLENQRVWIHKGTRNIIEAHPYFGVGSGNYKKKFEFSYLPLIEKKPYLYYEISITPKSHAHHDFLHFVSLGGFVAGTLFLFLWVQILISFLRNPKHSGQYLGIYSVFIAGFFQCYLLDDEVVLPFLGILSLLPGSNREITFRTKLKQSVLFLLFPLFISLSLIYLGTKAKEDELFFHRTRDIHNFLSPIAQKTINGAAQTIPDSEVFYFKLEGCLSHFANLNGKKRKREKPYSFRIDLPQSKEGTFPEAVKIELRERESFDQDQKFKAHKERILSENKFQLQKGENKFDFSNIPFSNSEEIYFLDFGIEYVWKKEKGKLSEKSIPVLKIEENCGE